jgi:hypothetical protein
MRNCAFIEETIDLSKTENGSDQQHGKVMSNEQGLKWIMPAKGPDTKALCADQQIGRVHIIHLNTTLQKKLRINAESITTHAFPRYSGQDDVFVGVGESEGINILLKDLPDGTPITFAKWQPEETMATMPVVSERLSSAFEMVGA